VVVKIQHYVRHRRHKKTHITVIKIIKIIKIKALNTAHYLHSGAYLGGGPCACPPPFESEKIDGVV